MKRLVLLIATLAVVGLGLACSSNSAPEATRIAPFTSQTVVAATTATATIVQPAPTSSSTVQPTQALPAATQPPAPQPTQPPAPQPTQPPAPQPTQVAPAGPVTLAVSASSLAFDRASISVPANSNITVNFTNNDTFVVHDFGVSIPFVPHTETCAGFCQASITFDSGPPGSYTFQCSVHPEMVGPFTVN